MKTRSRFATVLAALSAILGIIIILKGAAMWPFGSNKKELASILGPNAAHWLDGAEIAAWTPDLNFKPHSFFVARTMSQAEFRTWTKDAGLSVSETPSVPDGVFALPDGVTFDRWVGQPRTGDALDAQGTTSRATIWSRWQGGESYSVVHPTY